MNNTDNLTELVWKGALLKLARDDQESAGLLQEFDTSTPFAAVKNVIDDVNAIKDTHQHNGWNITIPKGTLGLKRTRVINIRKFVYALLEAALQFREVGYRIAAFDATKYGAAIWSVISLGMQASASSYGAYCWFVSSLTARTSCS
jgi:hypothetical protein